MYVRAKVIKEYSMPLNIFYICAYIGFVDGMSQVVYQIKKKYIKITIDNVKSPTVFMKVFIL